MSKVEAIHILYDIYMGWSHRTLFQILHANTGRNDLKRGELAIFMNRSWTACKILAPDGNMLYWRSPNGTQITIDQLKALPTSFGGTRFSLKGNLEAGALKRLQHLLQGMSALAS